MTASAPTAATIAASALPRPTTALVRDLPACFAEAYRARGIAIDLALARDQHQQYRDALRAAGLEIIALPADESRYDCVFVEDTAVVWEGRALIALPGPHRRGEEQAVAEALGCWHEVARLPPAACMEGGDVLHIGPITYIGLSRRTNEAGAAALAEFLAPSGRRVVNVPVERRLHLKTAATFLGDGTLLAAPGSVDARRFDVADVLLTDPAEPQAANCLRIGDALLVPAGCPRTVARLQAFADRHGVRVVPLDISQFERADGSLELPFDPMVTRTDLPRRLMPSPDASATAMTDLPSQYDHAAAQRRWYPFWERREYMHSEPDARTPYTIVIPPPNVTGALHLGHALNNTLQDVLVRQKRMQGYNVLWMPGTDHAGIATQAVVERRLLQEEKKSRHDLGREGLVARIWAWKDQYEKRIIDQLKQMGCSCDWQRTRFTFDDVCARAVRHTFFRMFQRGLIYRGKRLVNWDTFLQTAVSDDEVFHETVQGHFWHFRYPVIAPRAGEPMHVTIATTRPETMLGDTAVAVHPHPAAALHQAEVELRAKLAEAAEKDRADIQTQLDDLAERRRTFLPLLETLRDMARDGRMLELPLLKRPIPLVADEWARPELGTGCVKITPAHDPNDYEVGLRQKLPAINILNPDGTLNDAAGPYAHLKINQAREQVVADMEAAGLVERIEDREIELAHSDRSKTPIEPYLADQWFVRMGETPGTPGPGLSQSAMDAVTNGRVKIVPPRYAKSYLDWLSEKRDWPIGRQLWWGHRVPIWHAPTANEADLERAFAGREDVAWQRDEQGRWLICAQEQDLAEDAVPGHRIAQDDDVLDTWFSSSLWPHSTLGWPEKTPELAYYYPTSVLLTSRDIITLWVARMVLTGLFNLGEVPFREVYIHPKILDGAGETMSKSKGNGVDPLDVIAKFGADALRFGLALLATETQDARMPVQFECPRCQKLIEQTQKNRVLPRVKCPHCGGEFSTQWAEKPADTALPRGAVVSERFELARNFTNKLWNAARFALMNLEGYTPGAVRDADLTVEDRWLLSRLATVTQGVTDALSQYRFAEAARQLYDFAWDEFCSFYVEMVKSRLAAEGATGGAATRARTDVASPRAVAQRVLAHALDNLLRLLHPFTPFLTEEVWQRLGEAAPARGLRDPQPAAESVMIAPWPVADAARQDPTIEARFARFQEVLKGLREVRHRQNIPPKTRIAFAVRCDEAAAELLRPMAPYFETMAGATCLAFGPAAQPPAVAGHVNLAGIDLYVDLAGLIDVAAEIAKTEKEISKLAEFIAAKEKKLSNESFAARAPADVVQKERAGLEELRGRMTAAEGYLSELRKR